MKKTAKVVVMAATFVALVAGIAFADDNNNSVDIGLHNTVNATGGNANQNQDQNQNQVQDQRQMIMTPRSFLGLPTAPNIVGATLMGIEGCIPFPGSAEYSFEEIENMKSSSFLEKKGGWWHGLFSSRIKSSIAIPLKGGKRGSSIHVAGSDVSRFALSKKLGTFNCEGDYGYPLDATLGMCLSEAYAETAATVAYACYTVRRDGHLSGTAYSGGGGASTIPGNGNQAYSGAVSGTFGTSVAYANIAYDVTLVAFQGSVATTPVVQPSQSAPVVTPTPVVAPALAVCNPNEIFKRIAELKAEVLKCTRYCHNNLTLRSALGDAYVELYTCTDDKKYLKDARYNYEVAERNYRNGWDISSHRGEADQVIAQTYYNWAGVIYEQSGKAEAIKFAKAKKLERFPLGFASK